MNKIKFSLFHIYKEENSFIDGIWLQGHIGTLETAIQVVIDTEKANSNKINVAVIEGDNFSQYNYYYNLKRLDSKRNENQ